MWLRMLKNVDTVASHPDTWDVLAMLVRALRPAVVVEAGTYRGHATFAMAEAMWSADIDGHIYTADVEDHDIWPTLDNAGLVDYVTYHHGRFEQMLENVPGPINIAFIDASEDATPDLRIRYVNAVVPRLAPHGVVVVDDATDDGWPGAEVLRKSCGLYLPLGHGLAIYQMRA